MIFLLNREHIVWEAVELARLHMCEVLRVPREKVVAKVDLAGETLSPEFLIDMDDCEGVTPDQIRDVMRHTYLDCKDEMETRLKGAAQSRARVLEWLRGGMTEAGYAALADPAAVSPEEMADALAPVDPKPVKRPRKWVVYLWKLQEAWRWTHLVTITFFRRLAFWR